MKSIALITSHASSLVGFRAELIQALVAKGFKVWVLAPKFDVLTSTTVKRFGAYPVECSIERTGMNPFKDIVSTLRLVFLLRKLKPDIMLGYFIKPVIFGSIAGFVARVPRRIAMVEGLGFIFTDTGQPFSNKRKFLKFLVLNLYRLGMTCAHKVVFLNPDDRDELMKAGVVGIEKTYLLGGIGVDLDQWVPLPHKMQPITFLLVARLLREKGIEQYAEAARLVKNRHPGARFILLGGLDNNPGALSETDVLAWVKEGAIEWFGHTEVQPWMKETSVFVLPSWREGVPVSTQEAMASARPVITTDVPGCRQTVIDGENGFLVPPRNTQALVEAMCKFIDEPELIKSMGETSRRMAQEHYNVHEVNTRLMSILLGEAIVNEKTL